MERKLVRQGRNALTVTLPAKWLQSKGLSAGDSVFVTEQNQHLLVSTTSAAGKRSVTLDLRDAQQTMLNHVVLAKYIEGYDAITVLHDNPKAAQGIASYFIGMVVEEQTPVRMVLKSIISVPEDNFDAVLRRAAHIFIQQAQQVVALAQRQGTLEDVKAQEKMLDQNILYCLRYLSKYESTKHSYREFLICSTLELAADQISRIAKHIGRNVALAQTILSGVEEYVKFIFKHDFKRVYNSLRAFRGKVGTKTFADGLTYTLAEILYNYIGYIAASEAEQLTDE